MARLRVTSTVTSEMLDWIVNRSFTRWVSGIVSVGLNAMMLVQAVNK